MTNHAAASILQTEGALTTKVSFPSHESKEIDRQAWNTEAVNLFCYHRLFGRVKSSTRYRMQLSLHRGSVQPLQSEGSAAAWSQTTSSDISGLRLPASASCLGRHSHLAGRGPNSNSLFPPLAAVVAVALRLQGSGQGTSKKSFLPDPLLVLSKNRKARDTGQESMTTNFAISALSTV